MQYGNKPAIQYAQQKGLISQREAQKLLEDLESHKSHKQQIKNVILHSLI